MARKMKKDKPARPKPKSKKETSKKPKSKVQSPGISVVNHEIRNLKPDIPKSAIRNPKYVALRKEAEKILKSRKGVPDKVCDMDFPELLHEFMVYQAELEIQNEELRASQRQLEESQSKYSDLYDFAPIGYFTFDKKGTILEVNLTGAQMLGIERRRLLKKPFSLHASSDQKSVFFSHLKEVFRTGTNNTCELKLTKRDSSQFHARLESIAVSDNSKNFTCRTAISDVTELKLAEDETKRFASFPQLNPNPVLEVNSSGIIVFCNAAAVQALRKLNLRDTTLFLPDDLSDILDALKQDKDVQFSRQVKIKDRIFGEVLCLTPQFDSIRIYANDITERKSYQEALKNALQKSTQHEKTLRSERHRLTNILDSMVDGVYIVDQKYNIEYVNPEIEKEYGSVNGRSCHEYFEGLKKPCTWCQNEEVFKGKTVRWEWYSEKTNKTYDLINTPLKNPDGSISKLGIFRDITERKRAEDALRKSEERLQLQIDRMPIGCIVWDTEFRIVSWNPAAEEIFGFKAVEVLGKHPYGLIVPSEAEPHVDTIWHRLLQGDATADSVNENITRDGRIIYCSWSNTPLKDTDGSVTGVLSMVKDITERKQAEEALREIREDLDRAQAVGNIGSWRMDVQRNILTWSDENHRIFGLPKGTPMTYETFLSLVHPDDREYVDTKWKAGLAGENYDIEHRIVVDGKIKWVREKAYLEFDKNIALLGGFGITQDITERKQMEEELRKSRDELEIRVQKRTAELKKALRRMSVTSKLLEFFITKTTRKEYLDSAVDLLHKWTGCNCIGVRVLDKLGNIPYESYTGFSQEFWEAENWISVKNHQCACIRVVLQKPEPQDVNMMTANGSFYSNNTEAFADMLTEQELTRFRGLCIRTGFKSVAIIPIFYKEAVLGALHIADKRQGMVPLEKIEFIESVTPMIGEAIFRFSAEEALVKSEASLSEAQRIALMGNWEWNVANNTLTMSDQLYRIFAINKLEFQPTYESFLCFVHPDERENVRNAVRKAVFKKEPFDIDFRFIRTDGVVRVMRGIGEGIYDQSGNPLVVKGTGQDITERVKAEEALRESEERYRMLVETMNEGLGMDDENGLLIYANDRLCEMLGYSQEEIIGRPVLGFFDEKNQSILREEIEKRKRGETEPYRIEWIGKNNRKIITMLSPKGIFDDNGDYRGSFAVITDITEKLRLESIAEAVNTMENIGFIFSGIRHEIGNPVNSIKMALSVLKQNIDSYPIDKIKEYADRMLEEVSRMEYLLKAMKNFNMYETVELIDMNITDFMTKFFSLVEGDFEKRGIKVEITVSEPAWIYADPRALQQVLLNILTNAADAFEEQKNPRITICVLKMANMVNIRVEDNGSGMTEEQQQDLFKPFYTTKSKGTGLGLVIAKKMMTKMKGFIEVVSEKDKGTIVDLFLPEGISE
jgi:PAS domain S-box-containing protein